MQLLSTLDTTFKRSFSSFALKRLEAEKDQWQVPRHLGLIMDGNRRYARKHHIWDTKQKQFGHAQGAEKLEEVLHWCHELGIKIVSTWGLPLDNFRRDRAEVDTILELVKKKSDKFTHHPDAHAKQTRVRFLGELQHLPLDVQDAIHFTEEATKEHDQCLLNICLGYDGREEILTAFRRHLMVQLERRTSSGNEVRICPHAKHRLLEGYHLSILTTLRPYQSALYSSWDTNSDQPTSLMALLRDARIINHPR